MNLRMRFTLLIVGAILIPVLVMGISFTIFNNYMYPSDPRDIVREFNQTLEGIESVEQFNEQILNLENSYFSLIVETPELIASNSQDFNMYSRYPHDEKISPKVIIQSKVHKLKDGSEVLVILGLNMFDVSGRIFPVLFLISTLGALIVLSLVIIRSINRSIGKLEVATGEIADGNLNFELDTSGTDKFGSLARSLDTMRHQIKMEYDRRNRFFMGISHDLKTPLSSITGYADALIEGMAEDKKTSEKYLGIIKNKSHQLEQRISHLIHYIKLSNYDFMTSLEKKALVPYLEEFLEMHKEEAGFYNQTLNWTVDFSENPFIPFDEELLGRALENLIHNAFKYGLEGEPVSVYCSLKKNKMNINIENKGQKIPDDVLPYLFEPFFRGDKSRKGDGFGLGLASVKSIVESHGWSISVESQKEKTVFSISIPVS